MVSVSATDFKNIIQDSDISDENTERILDLAIDCLNLYGAELANMGGTAGSKTVSLESKEKGAVFIVARAIYYGFFKGVETSTIGGLTVSSPDLMSNQAVLASVKEASRRLTELDVDYG